jgi:hypothetical protein
MVNEPLDRAAASRLIRSIVASGTVRFSGHALEEMEKDGLIAPDILSVLRSGVVEPPEMGRTTWRCRVRTAKAYAVVAFRSEQTLVVLTAWRVK